MDDLVIRLWHRVGTVRAVFALVIVAGLVGGLAIANLTQRDSSTGPRKAAGVSQPLPSSSATPSASRTPWTLDEADAFAKAQGAASDASAAAKAAEDRKKAEEEASRSKTRTSAPPTKATPKYPVPSSCNGYSGNRLKGCAVLVGMGFGLDQMPCLDKLWTKESGWNQNAHNNSSNAHGIPQAVPGEKMAAAGPLWKTDAETQIRWGLGYIKGRYKTPCAAWNHSQAKNWY
jgi:hypothetical protein